MIILIIAVYTEESLQFFHICNRSKYYYLFLYIKIIVLPADGPVCCMFTLHKTYKISMETKGTINIQKVLGFIYTEFSSLEQTI